MAAKKENGNGIITATPVKKKATGVDDLQTLIPEQELIIKKQKIVFREYNFKEGQRVRACTKPFIDDLYVLYTTRNLSLENVMHLVAVHFDSLIPIIALSCGSDADLFSDVNDDEGSALIHAWWAAVGPFFLSRCRERMVGEIQEGKRKI